MVPKSCITGPAGLVMLLWFLVIAANPVVAAPAVHWSFADSDSMRIITVKGSQLPVMKRLDLTFSYVPSQVDGYNALARSLIPATAFYADTQGFKILVHVFATSSIKVSDGATLVVTRAPKLLPKVPADAFRLTAAQCTDANGLKITLPIDQVSILRNRRTTVPGSRAAGGMFTLDGRTIRISPGEQPGAIVVARTAQPFLPGSARLYILNGLE